METEKEYCTSCGYELQEGLCERCGNPQDSQITEPVIGSIVYIDKSKLHSSFKNAPFNKGIITREVKVAIDYHIKEKMWEVCVDEKKDIRLLFDKDSVSLNPIDTPANEPLEEAAQKYVKEKCKYFSEHSEGYEELMEESFMAGYKETYKTVYEKQLYEAFREGYLNFYGEVEDSSWGNQEDNCKEAFKEAIDDGKINLDYTAMYSKDEMLTTLLAFYSSATNRFILPQVDSKIHQIQVIEEWFEQHRK